MKKLLLLILASVLLPTLSYAQATPGPALPGAVPIQNTAERADALTNCQHSHTTGATITLTAGTASGPQGHIYIGEIDIVNAEGTAVTAAAPTYITTTGLNGNPQYQVASGPATAGTASASQAIAFTAPLQSATSGTNVTFILPSFITNQVISVNVCYRLGW